VTALATEPVVAPRALGDLARGYLALTKPRIIELLLVTTVPAMVVAERGLPSFWLILATLVGGSFAAGSANTINCYVDRDIDVRMHRTERRPLPASVVTPAEALRFGVVLGVLATLWLGLVVNWLSAVLALAAIGFYVFVYTLGMKRTTPSNIVIGGAAGCMPVLIGWSAVTGRVELPAFVMFAVIFYWTPPRSRRGT
jgi:heme o synthase